MTPRPAVSAYAMKFILPMNTKSRNQNNIIYKKCLASQVLGFGTPSFNLSVSFGRPSVGVEGGADDGAGTGSATCADSCAGTGGEADFPMEVFTGLGFAAALLAADGLGGLGVPVFEAADFAGFVAWDFAAGFPPADFAAAGFAAACFVGVEVCAIED